MSQGPNEGKADLSGRIEWHTLTIGKACEILGSNSESGLEINDALDRLTHYGKNEFAPIKRLSPLSIFIRQFASYLMIILLAAIAISAAIGEFLDAVIISMLVILSAIVGFVQEYRSERIVEALRQLTSPTIVVIRGGNEANINAAEVVPGDLVIYSEGDRISADSILIENHNMQTNESSLTGESLPSEKSIYPCSRANTPLHERRNLLYAGTSVISGRGKGLVFATGRLTEVGKVASQVESVGHMKTPFQMKLDQIGKLLGRITIVVAVMISVIGLYRDYPISEMFIWGISIAVAAIPEALPVIVTASLAIGASKMAKRNAVLKNLVSAETLGSATVICSDKTGTLTEGKMSVRKGYVYDTFLDVTSGLNKGIGHKEIGSMSESSSALSLLAKLVGLCNDSKIGYSDTARVVKRYGFPELSYKEGENNRFKSELLSFKGDATEVALARFSNQVLGMTKVELDSEYPRLYEIPFSSERKCMSTIHKVSRRNEIINHKNNEKNKDLSSNGNNYSRNDRKLFEVLIITKGATETILQRCNRIKVGHKIIDVNDEHRQKILQSSSNLASQGLRVIGVSFKEDMYDNVVRSSKNTISMNNSSQEMLQFVEVEHNMIFLGLVALMDPPRKQAIEAIVQCKKAGIRVVMITGDSKDTAKSIAREMGILDDDDRTDTSYEKTIRNDGRAGDYYHHHNHVPYNDNTLTGDDIDALSDPELNSAVLRTRVFARVLPKHKLRIVQSFKKNGDVVAMTGDGVNDAPALKAADIGIAMGMTGTQVSKEAASMILKDDDFATIVAAVKEGRRIMDNVKKYLVYLISANFGEILLLSSAVIVGIPVPLLAKQILYINLATDGTPAIALGSEPSEPDIMEKPPVNPRESLFSSTLGLMIGISIILWLTSFAIFWFTLSNGTPFSIADDARISKARTMAFAYVILFELFFAYSIRSYQNSPWKIGLTRNKFLLISLLGEVTLLLMILNLPILQNVFSLTSLQADEWILLLCLSPSGLVYSEVFKFAKRRTRRCALPR